MKHAILTRPDTRSDRDSGAGGTGRAARLRVAFLNTHPIQYFAPLYAYLTGTCGFDVTALYLADFSIRGGIDRGFRRSVTWDVDLLQGYEARFMGEAASRRRIGGFLSMVAPQLWPEILRGRYDAVVIHGYNLAAHHVALAAARASGAIVLARGETHLRLRRPGWRERLRRPLVRTHYAGVDGFLAIGSANAAYYEAMGIAPERISLVPYAVDNHRFVAAAGAARPERQATRARLGLDPHAPVVLYASKFDRRKRPADLLAAFARLRAEGVAAQLLMVGTGVLEGELRAAADGIDGVVFPGFANQTELPGLYAASDVFVLPSENEPWGLVVNEAMCAGLPVVASREIGCVDDLVTTGVNGATFAAGDVAGLADALRPILTDAGLRGRYGAASLARIGGWSYRECGAGLREAIDRVRARRAGRRRGRGNLGDIGSWRYTRGRYRC